MASHRSVLWFSIPEQSEASGHRVWIINAADSEASPHPEINYQFESRT